jgi:hypothetical protein
MYHLSAIIFFELAYSELPLELGILANSLTTSRLLRARGSPGNIF